MWATAISTKRAWPPSSPLDTDSATPRLNTATLPFRSPSFRPKAASRSPFRSPTPASVPARKSPSFMCAICSPRSTSRCGNLRDSCACRWRPEASRTATFTLKPRDLAYFNVAAHALASRRRPLRRGNRRLLPRPPPNRRAHAGLPVHGARPIGGHRKMQPVAVSPMGSALVPV